MTYNIDVKNIIDKNRIEIYEKKYSLFKNRNIIIIIDNTYKIWFNAFAFNNTPTMVSQKKTNKIKNGNYLYIKNCILES